MTDVKKKEVVKKSLVDEKPSEVRYHYAVGRRKAATAQIRLYADRKHVGETLIVNNKKAEEYFPIADVLADVLRPLVLVGLEKQVGISARVSGGGFRGQAEAIRLGIARALIVLDENLRPVLKSAKLLRRDPRVVERKKPGLRKARRAPQWSKR